MIYFNIADSGVFPLNGGGGGGGNNWNCAATYPAGNLLFFLGNNAQMLQFPLNYDQSLSSTTGTQFSAGVANLQCVAIDNDAGLMFVGTNVGIGLKFTIGIWDQLELFYSTYCSTARYII